MALPHVTELRDVVPFIGLVSFGTKKGQIGSVWDKSITFSDQISVRVLCYTGVPINVLIEIQ